MLRKRSKWKGWSGMFQTGFRVENRSPISLYVLQAMDSRCPTPSTCILIFRRYVTKSDIEELKLRGATPPAKPDELQPDGSLTPP